MNCTMLQAISDMGTDQFFWIIGVHLLSSCHALHILLVLRDCRNVTGIMANLWPGAIIRAAQRFASPARR